MRQIIASILCLLLLGACTHSPNNPPLAGDVFRRATGKWDMVGNSDFCKAGTDIEVISFSPDNRTAYFERPIPPLDDEGKPVKNYSYQVLYNDENSITMIVNGEKRITPNGDRFVWVLIMKDPDSFSWRATHWEKNARTKLTMGRCK